jgi:ribonuclease HI
MATRFDIYFDGGTNGSPQGKLGGYGSWEVVWNGFSKKVLRTPFENHKFDTKITNNIAEYLALIGALLWLQSVENKGEYEVKIHGDSMLVLQQLTGGYKIKTEHLKPFHGQCKNLLKDFFSWSTHWHPRIENVHRFGH